LETIPSFTFYENVQQVHVVVGSGAEDVDDVPSVAAHWCFQIQSFYNDAAETLKQTAKPLPTSATRVSSIA
jgi:hypothetical protein